MPNAWPTVMTNARAALFDLDGVLVDTAVMHHKAWQELGDELGFMLSDADAERTKGVSRMAALDIVLDAGGITATDAQKMAWATRKNDRYVEMISAMTPSDLLPGSVAFLQELGALGIRRALGSASKNAPMILDLLGITQYFEAIVDGRTVHEAKPHPAVFLRGAELLDVPAQYCVVYEDAIAGIQAAHAAGMFAVGIGRPDVLTEAELVISDLASATLDLYL